MINPKYDIQNINIEIITPMHIGDSQILNTLQYIYDHNEKKAYYLNPSKLFNYLGRTGKLDDYTNDVINGKIVSMYAWLHYKYNKDILNRLKQEKIIPEKGIDVPPNVVNKNNSLNNVKPFTRLVDGRIYIPGSTIKGTLQAGLIDYILNNNPKLKSEVKTIVETHNDSNKVLAKIFSVLEFDDNKRTNNSSLASVMKGFSISDAMSIENIDTILLKKVDIEKDTQHEISVYNEYVLPSTKFNCQISIEKSMLTKIGINSVQEIIDHSKNYFDSLNAYYFYHFGISRKNELKAINDANAYIGANTNLLAKSLLFSLYGPSDELFNKVQTILSRKFSKRKKEKDKTIVPRMLKGVKYKGRLWLTGGVRFEIEK